MSEKHRIEIEIDDHCYQALVGEAERLGIGVPQIVERAAAAWLIEIAENTTGCRPVATLVG